MDPPLVDCQQSEYRMLLFSDRGRAPMNTKTAASTASSLSDHESRVISSVPRKLLIGGEWVDAEHGAQFDVLDPSTGEILCSVADASPADGRRALDAAVAAQASFAATSPR